jgi:GR25 family glycosyltransferase involved in LPS biosynthesis
MVCINLKHRADRWERFSAQPGLKRLLDRYTFERFDAVNGSALDIKNDMRISLRTKRNILEHVRRDHEELDSAGGVGCYLSHTSVWANFLKRSEPYLMVFEDDAVIPVTFADDLTAAMRESTLLPQLPDVWFFSKTCGWYYDYKGKARPKDVKGGVLGPWTLNTCAAFTGYIISRRGAERLLETAFPLDMHVDLYACLNGELGRILTVSHERVRVKPVELKESDTDIQVASDCTICNVPTHFGRKGMVVVSVPIMLVTLAALGTLAFLSQGRGGRR